LPNYGREGKKVIALKQFKRGSRLVKAKMQARQKGEEKQGNWEKPDPCQACQRL
jgi:hypothetical protein